MHIPISKAKAHLTDIVHRAENGEHIVLTRHGHAIVSLEPVVPAASEQVRRKVIQTVMEATEAKLGTGPSAARSQDFLYDSDGLPE